MAIEKIVRKKGTVYRALVRSGRTKVSRCFCRKVDAERWEREQLVQRHNTRDEKHPSDDAPPITLNDLRLRFEMEYAPRRQAPSTTKLETGTYRKHIAPHLGDSKLDQITEREVEKLIGILASANVSNGRINRVRTLLHSLFNRAVRWKVVKHNPVSEVAALPTDNRALAWIPMRANWG
jgi:hypothetical protein